MNIQVSQDSATTYLRLGGKFYSTFFCSLSHNAKVKQILKSIHQFNLSQKDSVDVFFTHGDESTANIFAADADRMGLPLLFSVLGSV